MDISQAMVVEDSNQIRERYVEAIELCADDAGVPLKEVCVLYQAHRSKNLVYFLGTSNTSEGLKYVLKANRRPEYEERWSSEREYEGLKFVYEKMNMLRGYGCIRPVGYGLKPQYLVSCYFKGRTIQPVIDRAASCCGTNAFRDEAGGYAERMGWWLRKFRETQVHHGKGMSIEGYTAFCDARIDEMVKLGLDSQLMKSTMTKIEGYLAVINDVDREMIGASYPTHNDFWAQNFHVDEADIMYPMDMEAFAFEPLNNDLYWFRSRLEWKYMLSKGKLGVWKSFLKGYGIHEEGVFSLLSYLYCLVQDMAWKGRREYRRGRGWRTSIRDRIWFFRRLGWLKELPVDLEEACEYFSVEL